ncbi:hypothetical protein [Hymenobacter lutimineralis]|uniref:hypothetical protein n=1 Tax=Hymenobacter lutimineralis TaxID=2606448 RepID=UPI001655167B|nr:hypothetical protein [Hymenobacter lutimineralis]
MPPHAAPAPRPAATHADTVQALHHLFAKHRTGGWIWTTIGGLFAVRIATVAAASSSSGSLSSNTGGTIVGIGLFGGVPAGIGIGKLARFSKANEEQTVVLYDKAGILPPYVRTRLRKKYFLK